MLGREKKLIKVFEEWAAELREETREADASVEEKAFERWYAAWCLYGTTTPRKRKLAEAARRELAEAAWGAGTRHARA